MDLIVTTYKKEKNNFHNQVLEMRKEVEQAETVRVCIEEILQGDRELTQVKKQELELQKYSHETACIKWHCKNEVFSAQEYIRANCEYPGAWDGEIERIEEIGNTIIAVARVFPVDRSSSSRVVSFINKRMI